MKNGIRVAICVMLVVAVLAMSLSVFADYEYDNQLLDFDFDQVAFLVWQLLQSWGIDVSYQQITDYTTPVQEQIQEWIFEYLDSQPSIETVASWVFDWYFETDFWGHLVVNNSLLDDVVQFANWLQDKYGLVDNSIEVISPQYQLNNLKVYKLPVVWIGYYNHTTRTYEYTQVVLNPDMYVMFSGSEVSGNTNINMIIFKQNTSAETVNRLVNGSVSPSTTITDWRNTWGGNSTSPWYWYSLGVGLVYTAELGEGVTDFGYQVYQSESVGSALTSNDTVMQVGDSYILTSSIIIPDIQVIGDDGMVIVDGQPIYQEVVVPDTITVNNLPAIVSTSTVSNPGLETFWGFIPVLAEQTKDAIVLTRGLIYELPEELVVTFYAVMGGLILFGVIKLMREH